MKPKGSKRVRITLEMDSHFLQLLQAKVSLHYLQDGEPRADVDPAGVLALLVLAEGRGMTELQVAMAVPPAWRQHIDSIPAERRVIENQTPRKKEAGNREHQ